MALGAYQSQSVSAAQARARLLGRAVPVTVNGVTMVAYPNGNLGGYGARGGTVNALAPQTVAPSTPASNVAGVAGPVGSPSGPAASTGPFGITSPTVAAPAQTSLLQRPSLITNQQIGANTGLFTPTNQQVGATITAPQAPTLPAAVPSVDDYGRVIPTINVTAPPQQTVLNQANPQTTYVSPATAQPAGAPPVAGQTDTQSGPAVHATYNMPPAPTLAAQAKNYRAQHGLSDDAETEALNTESLAAARAGRTSLDPTLAAQYGQAPAAGTYGPRTDVVNALTAPQTSGQPIMLAPTTAATVSAPAAAARYDWPANMQAQNLLQQGVY